MTWLLYLAIGFGCMSIGACVGFVTASAMFEVKHAIERRHDRFFQ